MPRLLTNRLRRRRSGKTGWILLQALTLSPRQNPTQAPRTMTHDFVGANWWPNTAPTWLQGMAYNSVRASTEGPLLADR